MSANDVLSFLGLYETYTCQLAACSVGSSGMRWRGFYCEYGLVPERLVFESQMQGLSEPQSPTDVHSRPERKAGSP